MRIGSVIRTFVPETNPPKVKLFIVVGETNESLATVYINSEARRLTVDLQGMQYPLQSRDCNFLTYDSFVDCSDLQERNKGKVNLVLIKDPTRLVGIIPPAILQEIISLLKKSKGISFDLKKKYATLMY